MSNWLADPVACAIRLKDKGGCIILAGREGILSRSTRVYREDASVSGRKPIVAWKAGHMEVFREDYGTEKGKLRLRIWVNAAQGSATPPLTAQEANLASDLLRAAAVDAGGQACGGQTILELLWEEMDRLVEGLMTDTDAEDGGDANRAQGLAYAIAVMQNPYRPSIDSVKEQAMERWENAGA